VNHSGWSIRSCGQAPVRPCQLRCRGKPKKPHNGHAPFGRSNAWMVRRALTRSQARCGVASGQMAERPACTVEMARRFAGLIPLL
jgi:hypothetical protein